MLEKSVCCLSCKWVCLTEGKGRKSLPGEARGERRKLQNYGCNLYVLPFRSNALVESSKIEVVPVVQNSWLHSTLVSSYSSEKELKFFLLDLVACFFRSSLHVPFPLVWDFTSTPVKNWFYLISFYCFMFQSREQSHSSMKPITIHILLVPFFGNWDVFSSFVGC